MIAFKKILVATDTHVNNHPIIDEAALISMHNDSALKIVDVVPEFSWIVRLALGDRQDILETITAKKQKDLELLAAPLRKRGLNVETEVLSGTTSIAIIREVLRGNHDLVFRVAKGKNSRRKGFFGTTGIRLLRDCPCPVWLATASPSPQYNHVMACIDTSSVEPVDAELNAKVYEAASFVSHQHRSRLSTVQAWTIYGEEFLFTRTRMEDFEQLSDDVRKRVKALLDQFLMPRGSSVDANNVHMIKGDAANVLPAFAAGRGVDLIVMGTVARTGAAGFVMGNTAERILDRIECSVLALKPNAFVCPIRLPNAD